MVINCYKVVLLNKKNMQLRMYRHIVDSDRRVMEIGEYFLI